jgi:dienelactone hydrolase
MKFLIPCSPFLILHLLSPGFLAGIPGYNRRNTPSKREGSMVRSVWVLVLLLPLGCRRPPPPPPEQHAPEPPAIVGEKVIIGAGKEKAAAFLYRPAGKGPFAAVILVPDAKGLADWVKEKAKKLADDYVVLALDLPGGKEHPDKKRVLAEIKEAVDYLAARSDVRAGHLGVIGWGAGGGAALEAVTEDTRLRAVVDLDGPLVYDPKKLHRLQASIWVYLPGKETNALKDIDRFNTALEKADRRADATIVNPFFRPGVLNPTNPNSDKKEIDKVWTRIYLFLMRNLMS